MLYLDKMVIFGQNSHVCAKVIECRQKWLYLYKVIIFRQEWFNLLGQTWFYFDRMVEFGEPGLVWTKVAGFRQKLL